MKHNTKKCSKCQETKALKQFRFRNKSKGTRQSWCKSCTSEYEKKKWKISEKRRSSNIEKNNERKLRNKKFIWDYLSNHPCEDCGEDDPIVLEFDHLDRDSKSFNISDICKNGYSIKRIEEEIEKCRVLCANCHRRHACDQLKYWKG